MKIACLVSILQLHTVILSGAKDLEIVRRPALSGTPQNDIQKHGFRMDTNWSKCQPQSTQSRQRIEKKRNLLYALCDLCDKTTAPF